MKTIAVPTTFDDYWNNAVLEPPWTYAKAIAQHAWNAALASAPPQPEPTDHLADPDSLERALPLSELVIELHRSYLLDRSLMLDPYIQSPYMQEVANKLCDQALRAIELERHLKAQAEWGVNQFDRAEKAVAAVAEKDREIAELRRGIKLCQVVIERRDAELTELKARAKP